MWQHFAICQVITGYLFAGLSPKHTRDSTRRSQTEHTALQLVRSLLEATPLSYPLRVFDEVAPTRTLVDPLRVDAFFYGSLGLSNDLPELGILRELVPVRLPRRTSAVPVEERLSFPAASRAACRDADHGARRASKRAPGAGGLGGTVAEIARVPERRDKRTRLVHRPGGGRSLTATRRGANRGKGREGDSKDPCLEG